MYGGTNLDCVKHITCIQISKSVLINFKGKCVSCESRRWWFKNLCYCTAAAIWGNTQTNQLYVYPLTLFHISLLTHQTLHKNLLLQLCGKEWDNWYPSKMSWKMFLHLKKKVFSCLVQLLSINLLSLAGLLRTTGWSSTVVSWDSCCPMNLSAKLQE